MFTFVSNNGKIMELKGFAQNDYKRRKKPLELVNYSTHRVIEEGNENPHYTIEFDSIEALVKCVDENSKEHGNKSWTNKGVDLPVGSAWVWGLDREAYGHALTKKHLLEGRATPSMLDLYEKTKEELEENFPELFELRNLAVKTRRRRKFAEEGDELDIDRYMSGDPEQWQTITKVKDKKTIKLFFNASISADNASKRLTEVMILCSVFVEIVTALNLSVEFWYGSVCYNLTDTSDIVSLFIKFKSADDPVDIQSFLSLGLPGLFRFFIFRLEANLIPGRVSEGLGSVLRSVPDWVLQMYEFDVCLYAGRDVDETVKSLIKSVKFLMK